MPLGRLRSLARLLLPTILSVVAGATALAQRGGYQGGPMSYSGNQRYDGRFVFVRVSYTDYRPNRQGPHWSHDYPRGEEHFMKILDALTTVPGHVEEHNIMSLTDPEIFKFPVLYMCEPGYWSMTDVEGAALRAHLLKGGFVIFDDFGGSVRRNPNDWANLEAQMARVLPEAHWIDVPATHQIFHTFYEILDPPGIPQYYDIGPPIFRALFEDNDPKKRMLAFANFNTDISEFWEWSDSGYKPVDESNEAYKVGVNEFMYGMIH